MRHHVLGRIWGAGQLLFWIILLPWITITIPLRLYFRTHQAPAWLETIYNQPWVSWEGGVVIISTFNMLLVCITLVWIGWHKMHPLVEANEKPSAKLPLKAEGLADEKISPISASINRLSLVQSFSKEAYLQDIKNQAHDEATRRKKRRERCQILLGHFNRRRNIAKTP